MICKGIYEVLTPSVRLSRFATHVETGRPRKSGASIHGGGRSVCKRCRTREPGASIGRFASQMSRQEFLDLGKHSDPRGACRKPVVLAVQGDELMRLAG